MSTEHDLNSLLLHNHEHIRQRSMQSLFDAFETQCEGTVVVDRESRIIWINDRYATRLGAKSAADALGRPVEEVIPNSLMRRVVQTGEPILLDVMETKGATFVVTRIPLKDENGVIIGAAGFALFDQVQSLKPLFDKFTRMQRELAAVQKRLAEERRPKYTLSNFIGTSPPSMEVKHLARRAAQLDATVLLLGETGTGKELLAQAIHMSSQRWEKPFIGVNVAAIPETLLEAEFFGVAAGAYTGADRRGREGKFQLANGGTLFLDEIGDMPILLQAKLLRVLQEQEYEAVGSNRMVKTDVRVIAATSVNLRERVDQGLFRADLYYRLNVLSITIPPLRERLSDMDALCEEMLEQIGLRSALAHRELHTSAITRLRQYAWPGNIRELRNVLEKALMLSDKRSLEASDFDGILPAADSTLTPPLAISAITTSSENPLVNYAEAFVEFETRLIKQTLAATPEGVDEAARRLGLSRASLYRKMRALGIRFQDQHAKDSPT